MKVRVKDFVYCAHCQRTTTHAVSSAADSRRWHCLVCGRDKRRTKS